MRTTERPFRRFYALTGLLLFCVITKANPVTDSSRVVLTLQQAIEMARTANKHIVRSYVNRQIASGELEIAKEKRLPELSFHSSYARITRLTEFHKGVPEGIKTIPDISDATLSTRATLYAGGRIKTAIAAAATEEAIAELNNAKTINDIHIQVVATYLGIYKLMSLQSVIKEQIEENKKRLKEVQALKRNGVVTRNEILRAELQLSDMELSLISNRKNTDIAIQELKTLLNLEEVHEIELDTLHLSEAAIPEQDYESYVHAALNKEEMQIARHEEKLAVLEKREVKAANYPVIALFGSYAYKYPDYLLFPPNPYWYSMGTVGIDLSFSLSELYKNRKHIGVVNQKISGRQVQTGIVHDALVDQVYEEYVQLQEIKERIPVTEKAILQAEENYRIVKTKYLNQLALITEMTDADNALLAARFQQISEKINAQMKYYQLRYAAGMLLH